MITLVRKTPREAKRSRSAARADWSSLIHSAIMSRRAGQGLLRGGYGLFRIDKGCCLYRGILFFLGENDLGQGFQTPFPGHRGPGATLRPEGEINIFQNGHGLRSQNLFLQIISEELPLLEGFENSLSSFVQLSQLLQSVADGRDLHFIQRSRDFFPIAGNERDGCPFSDKLRCCLDLSRRQPEFFGDLQYVSFIHFLFPSLSMGMLISYYTLGKSFITIFPDFRNAF